IIYMAPGDELLSDSFPFKEIENGIIWEVEGKQLSGSFVGESMQDNGSMVFANYKEGATDPTFLYLALGLKEVKC
ncbi:hypothetical protein BHM03_00009247, partial [Ensete ventricosum]